jgi:hypothetical protein
MKYYYIELRKISQRANDKFTRIIMPVFLGIFLSSCSGSFLDKSASSSIPEEDIFSDPELMKLMIYDMYNDVPNFDWIWPYGPYDNITDESRSYWGNVCRDVLLGQWFPDYNPLDYWAYGQVRKTNLFLDKVDQADINEEDKHKLKGEVLFLRAKLYFDMVKRYGGVPVITEPQDINDDLFVSRSSIDESFQFIIEELEEAITLLPETYGDRGVDVSRVNKHSAKAFLGRVCLFWASPLYNSKADVFRWEKAAEICKEVINAGVYDLLPEFRNIMLDKNNIEEIFSVQFLKGVKEHGWDSWHQPDSQSRQFASARCPLQDFVDAFEMANGKAIDESDSGYDENNPYENRDPRLLKTVVVNGSLFFGNPIYMYVGGLDGINDPYQTVTGYQLRKGTNESNMDYYGGSGSDQNWIELRYAEVLLNYAEAQNEALQVPDQSIYDAIEKIRQRAGLIPYTLPKNLTKDQMRERIRHERYIELAFEQKRYWDLRRWKIAKEVLDGKVFNAMYITKNDDGTYSYEKKPVDGTPCVFQEKMYFMPIPQREMEKNPNLVQNEGW